MSSEAKKAVKALGLSSGGLDSILSALVLKDQGIHAEWIVFTTPFFSADSAENAARKTGIPITVLDITDEYLKMLLHPPFGYGKNMNPCPDCHSLMFKVAGRVMVEKGFDFLFSGEVLGQRPMSQNKSCLRYVEKHSGFDGLILRPLSAKKLPVTIPEEKGLVDRNLLLDFSGRSRKPQMMLAEKLGVTEYPSPAGGCLLTDKVFSQRLFDYLTHRPSFLAAHKNRNEALNRKLPCRKGDPAAQFCDLGVIRLSEIHHSDLHLLKVGRHFRLPSGVKLICGRNKNDNAFLPEHFNPEKDVLIKPFGFPGPTAVIPDGADEENTVYCGRIVAGYGKLPPGEEGKVIVICGKKKKTISVTGVLPKDVNGFLI